MRKFYPEVDEYGNKHMDAVDIMDKSELLYLEIARAMIDYSNCLISVLFYHTLLKKNVFWAKVLLIAREKSNFISSITISSGNDVVVHKELDDVLKRDIEKTFGSFFFRS